MMAAAEAVLQINRLLMMGDVRYDDVNFGPEVLELAAGVEGHAPGESWHEPDWQTMLHMHTM